MNAILSIMPLVGLVGLVASMMITILAFDRLRGTRFKDWLAGFWKADRRRVLHLAKQNGFYFFVDRLIAWSDPLVRFSWLVALPACAAGNQALMLAGFLVSLCWLIRSATLSYLAASRVSRFSRPLDHDGFGVYAKSATGWREFGRSLKVPLAASGLAAPTFLGAALFGTF